MMQPTHRSTDQITDVRKNIGDCRPDIGGTGTLSIVITASTETTIELTTIFARSDDGRTLTLSDTMDAIEVARFVPYKFNINFAGPSATFTGHSEELDNFDFQDVSDSHLGDHGKGERVVFLERAGTLLVFSKTGNRYMSATFKLE